MKHIKTTRKFNVRRKTRFYRSLLKDTKESEAKINKLLLETIDTIIYQKIS